MMSMCAACARPLLRSGIPFLTLVSISQNRSFASCSVKPCCVKKFIISLATLVRVSFRPFPVSKSDSSPYCCTTTAEEDDAVISGIPPAGIACHLGSPNEAAEDDRSSPCDCQLHIRTSICSGERAYP